MFFPRITKLLVIIFFLCNLLSNKAFASFELSTKVNSEYFSGSTNSVIVPGGKYVYADVAGSGLIRYDVLTRTFDKAIDFGFGDLVVDSTGTYLYAASGNEVVKILISENRIVFTYKLDLDKDIGAINITPDNKFLYIALGTSVELLNLQIDAVDTQNIYNQHVNSIAVQHDGLFAYFLVDRGEIVKIDTINHNVYATKTIGTSVACGIGQLTHSLAISDDDTYLLLSYPYSEDESCLNANKVYNFYLPDFSQPPVVYTVGSGPNGLSISHDRTLAMVANYGDASVSLIDLIHDSVTATIPVGFKPSSALFLRGGQLAIAFATDPYSSMLTAYEIYNLNPEIKNPSAVAISHDGIYGSPTTGDEQKNASFALVADNINKVVRKIRTTYVPELAQVDEFPLSDLTSSIVISPNDQIAFIALTGYKENPGNSILKIDASTDQVLASIKVGVQPLAMHFSSTGEFIYVLAFDGTLTKIDANTNEIVSSINIGNNSYDFALSPDGNFAYAGFLSGEFTSKIAKIDLSNDSVSYFDQNFGLVQSIAVSKNGGYLLAADSDKYIHRIDLKSQLETSKISVGLSPAWISISPSGEYAFVGSGADPGVFEIDLQTNEVIKSFYEGTQGFVQISPDGNFTLVGNLDGNTMKTLVANPIFSISYNASNQKFGPLNTGGPIPVGNFSIDAIDDPNITFYPTTGVGIFHPQAPFRDSYKYEITETNIQGDTGTASINLTLENGAVPHIANIKSENGGCSFDITNYDSSFKYYFKRDDANVNISNSGHVILSGQEAGTSQSDYPSSVKNGMYINNTTEEFVCTSLNTIAAPRNFGGRGAISTPPEDKPTSSPLIPTPNPSLPTSKVSDPKTTNPEKTQTNSPTKLADGIFVYKETESNKKVSAFPSKSLETAPKLQAPIGVPFQPVLKALPPKLELKASLSLDGKTIDLGKVKVDVNGVARLPVLQLTHSGTYLIKLMDTSGKPYLLKINVKGTAKAKK